jgi:hypothetical protein
MHCLCYVHLSFCHAHELTSPPVVPDVKTEPLTIQDLIVGSPGVFSYDSKPSSTPELSHSREPANGQRRTASSTFKSKPIELKPNSSIPANLSWEEFARQSIVAAESSRLNPFSLLVKDFFLRNSKRFCCLMIYTIVISD